MILLFHKVNPRTNYFEASIGVVEELEKVCFFADEEINLSDNKTTWKIEPYVHFSRTDYKVGMRIKEVVLDNETGELKVKEYRKGKKSEFRLSTKVLMQVVNLEACIIEQITESNIDGLLERSFQIDYSKEITYIRLSNINERVKRYLLSFDKLELEEEVIRFGEYQLKRKLLNSFLDELSLNLDSSEPGLQRCFEKYQELLPLIIPNIDATLEFQYRIISDEQLDTNIPDGLSQSNLGLKNIIELKRADCSLFDKRGLYRNNTLSLTKEFSSAIQQANIQRARIANSSTDMYSPLTKSTLIIGNIGSEFTGHKYEKLLHYNFNVVKFNNKDLQIITYDEIIYRISILIAQMDGYYSTFK